MSSVRGALMDSPPAHPNTKPINRRSSKFNIAALSHRQPHTARAFCKYVNAFAVRRHRQPFLMRASKNKNAAFLG